MDSTLCNWDTAKFLIFSQNVFDPLIYYSHLTALVLSLVFGFFVFWNNRKSIITKVLFIITLFLSYWLFGDLTLWATEKSYITMFAWSTINLVEPFIYAFSLYFIYLFIDKQDVSLKKKFAIFLPLLVTIILTPTIFALLGFNLTTCDRDAIEGPLVYYGYLLEIIYTLWIVVVAFSRYKKAQGANQKHQISLAATGTVLFLLSFAFGNIIGSLFTDLSFLGEDYSWTIGQYGLFGVPIFIGLLSYMIVRFKAFNIKLFAAQALVAALVFLVGSEFFFVTTVTNQILVGVTLILVSIGGFLLVKSVKREIEQREKIQKLASELQIANAGQVSLMHSMNHQVKGKFGNNIVVFDELLNNPDYVSLPNDVKKLLQQGFEDSTAGVDYIQNILKGAGAQNGTLPYDMKSMDLKQLVLDLTTHEKVIAEKRELSFETNISDGDYTITGDVTQLREALRNIIENAIKYNSEKGSIAISLSHRNQKILFAVRDTGIGISKEDEQKLFKPGGMGKDSMKYNVDASGFGLAFVKPVIEKHAGRVWHESNGSEKGTTFFVELPN